MTTQQPTREQVVQWAQMGAGVNVCGGSVILGFQDISNICALARADLEATVKEQAAEIAEYREANSDLHKWRTGYRQQLAAAQLCIEQLREALREAMDWNWLDDDCSNIPVKEELVGLLSTQPDLSALEAERQRVAEACAKWVEAEEAKAGGQELSARWYAKHLRAGQWKDHK